MTKKDNHSQSVLVAAQEWPRHAASDIWWKGQLRCVRALMRPQGLFRIGHH